MRVAETVLVATLSDEHVALVHKAIFEAAKTRSKKLDCKV